MCFLQLKVKYLHFWKCGSTDINVFVLKQHALARKWDGTIPNFFVNFLAGFASVEVVKHPDAARQMIEVSGMEPPAGAEHLMSVNITAGKAAACCSPTCCS